MKSHIKQWLIWFSAPVRRSIQRQQLFHGSFHENSAPLGVFHWTPLTHLKPSHLLQLKSSCWLPKFPFIHNSKGSFSLLISLIKLLYFPLHFLLSFYIYVKERKKKSLKKKERKKKKEKREYNEISCMHKATEMQYSPGQRNTWPLRMGQKRFLLFVKTGTKRLDVLKILTIALTPGTKSQVWKLWRHLPEHYYKWTEFSE